jgi:hypothetical protein
VTRDPIVVQATGLATILGVRLEVPRHLLRQVPPEARPRSGDRCWLRIGRGKITLVLDHGERTLDVVAGTESAMVAWLRELGDWWSLLDELQDAAGTTRR